MAATERVCAQSRTGARASRRATPGWGGAVAAGRRDGTPGGDRGGVDLLLYRRAARDGKPTSGLEPIERHLGYLLEMGQEDTDLFLRQMLDELEQSGEMLDPLIEAWRSGDEQRLESLLVEELRIGYASVYKRLLVDRNELWWPVLQRLMQTPETELVLVGAAHLIGPDGLLTRFRAQGMTVEPLD
ncbi:TraB/GumN family protein [Marinobacterium aestuariivivens]|uniref:TraB/GumN family protein n=1 Tax=Marinobacterium aestuariivivens TaxID=1698799 RepID=A0ABW2A6I0_9GAMM